MSYVEQAPSPDLRADVQCVWELRDDGDPFSQPIFPDGRVEIVCHLGDRPTAADTGDLQPDLMVVGQMTRALRVCAASRVHAVGIRFTPAGARRWLALPLHELTDRTCGLGDLDSALARRLRDAVGGPATHRERMARVEAVLRDALRATVRVPDAVRHATGLTLRRGGLVGIDDLAARCGLSTRQLERQFLEAVGLTPKTFARTVRFERVLRTLRAGVPPIEAAHRCGFADQSHLANEFRRVAGGPARQIQLAEVAFLEPPQAGAPTCPDSRPA